MDKKPTNLEEFLENKAVCEWDFVDEKMPAPVSWKELRDIPSEGDPWLVKNLIPREGITILASVSGEGKSIIVMHLAKCLSEGLSWFGHPAFATAPARVLYVNMEMSISEMQRRGRKIGFDSSNANLHILNEDDFNLNAGGVRMPNGEMSGDDLKYRWLLTYIHQKSIQVVVIDTFRAASGGLKEEKAEEVRSFFKKFQLLKNSGVSVIFLEHVRKPTQLEGKTPKKEQLLGSQDKTANAEVLLMIRKDESTGFINVYERKNRLGPEIPPFAVKVSDIVDEENQERLAFEYMGELEDDATKKDEAKNLILTLLEDGEKSTKQIIDVLKKQVGQKNIRAALREMEAEVLVDRVKHGRENLFFLPKEAKEPENPVVEELDDSFLFNQ